LLIHASLIFNICSSLDVFTRGTSKGISN
jgi:hypothetical protein